MRKLLMLLFIGIIACTGCNKKPEVYVLNATVLENYEECILVEPVAGSEELNSVHSMYVYLSDDDRDLREYYPVGSEVSIGYNGVVLETSPGQIYAYYINLILE